MLNWEAKPLVEVNGIKFGMSREDVRKVLGGTYREFKKSKFSKTMTDDFGVCHVFYNTEGRCEAVEIFDKCQVSIDGKVVFPLDVQTVKEIIPDLEEDTGSYISKKLSIGIYAPGSTAESILFGYSGYYEE